MAEDMEALTRRLLSTTDAMEWAQAFVAVVADDPHKCLDVGLMVSWFANAIETGRAAGVS